MSSRSLTLFALAVVVVGPALVGCASAPYEIVIEPSRANCTGLDEQLCLDTVVDGERSLNYDGIEGFSYQWCQRHTLRIHEEPVVNPPADGSSIRLVLDEELEATEVPGHEFTLTVFDHWASEDEIGVLDFTPRCAAEDGALCDELLTALQDDGADRVQATFRCEAGEAAPRLLSFVEPSPA